MIGFLKNLRVLAASRETNNRAPRRKGRGSREGAKEDSGDVLNYVL